MVQEDLIWFRRVPPAGYASAPQKHQLHFEKENEFLSIWIERADLLVKDIRAYACTTEENWVTAIDQGKGDLLLHSLNFSGVQA